MRQLGIIWIIARREFAGYFHAPTALVVSVAFLILQGFLFYATVEVLADPAQPAPIGAVLASYFGGTSVWWAVVLSAISALAMRLCAEDKRQGTWETLLTAPVDEGPVVTGKWLGSVLFYALLWLPTLAYPAILAGFAPPGTALDIGPIAASYAGVIVTGMALLAIGVAASASTDSQIVAAVATFALGLLILVTGQIPDVASRWAGEHPLVARLLGHVDLRGHMDDLARGDISSSAMIFFATLTGFGLAAATSAALWGRRRRAEMSARALALGLLAIIAVSLNILAARHDARWDLSQSQLNSLDPRTRSILASIEPPGVDMLVVRAGLEVFAGVQDEIDRLLERMTAVQPLLHMRVVDPALDPGRIEALATEFAQAPENLRDGGLILFQHAQRRRAVDLFDMAEFADDRLGVGNLARFRAERALASAIDQIVDPDRPTICYTTDHGEMALESSAVSESSWAGLARRIERDGGVLERLDRVDTGVPTHCRVLVVAGPRRVFSSDEAGQIAEFLARGGSLFLAVAEAPLAGAQGGRWTTGLELILAEYGVALPAAIAVDPEFAVDTPAQWFTTEGYGEHPVTASFHNRRLTLWLAPRVIALAGDPADRSSRQAMRSGVRAQRSGHSTVEQTALVRSSELGFGETDLAGLRAGRVERGPRDLAGPVTVAAAIAAPLRGTRIVVFGGAYSLSSAVTRTRAPGNELLAAAAVDWLAGKRRSPDIGAKIPQSVHLIMTRSQKSAVFALAVVVLPGLLAMLGAIIW